MTVSYTDRTGITPARVKMGVPWPVDPVEYPLHGPDSGPVYAPHPLDSIPLWMEMGGYAIASVIGVSVGWGAIALLKFILA